MQARIRQRVRSRYTPQRWRVGSAVPGVVAVCLALVLGLGSAAPSAESLPQASRPSPELAAVIDLVDAGRFADADAAIERALADDRDEATLRDALAFQRERMRRIGLDFGLDAAGLEAALRRQIPDLRPLNAMPTDDRARTP